MYLLLTRMNGVNEKVFKTKADLDEAMDVMSSVYPEMEMIWTELRGGDQMKTTKKKTKKKTAKKAKKK